MIEATKEQHGCQEKVSFVTGPNPFRGRLQSGRRERCLERFGRQRRKIGIPSAAHLGLPSQTFYDSGDEFIIARATGVSHMLEPGKNAIADVTRCHVQSVNG